MIEYRIAGKEDLPGILVLYKQFHPGEQPIGMDAADKLWEQSGRQGLKYFIAADGDRVVSTLNIAVIPNLTRGGRSNAFIENVVTDEEYRRKGIGRKLIEKAVNYARENNCYKVVLLSSMKRKEAHVFYESCGFDGNSKRGFEIRF